MGNSDSKQPRSVRQSLKESSGTDVVDSSGKLKVAVMSEFDTRCDPVLQFLTLESFHKCLRSLQNQFNLYHISESPLAIGLFRVSIGERTDGKEVMTKEEYSSAVNVLLNNNEHSLRVNEMTKQSIDQWYYSSVGKSGTPQEIMVAFMEASWKFAFSEMHLKLLSNVWLNGCSDAISRFSLAHLSKLSSSFKSGDLGSDRTITVCLGDESVSVPTSFSFLGKSVQKYPEL